MELKEITARLLKLKERLEKEEASAEGGKVKVFISAGSPDARAVVFTGVGNTFQTAFKAAQDKTIKHVKEQEAEPDWLKADLVKKEYHLSPEEWVELASKVKRYYFPYGVSLDSAYNDAFLHQEINEACLIKYTKERKKWPENEKIDRLVGSSRDRIPSDTAQLHINNVNHYLKHVRKLKKAIKPEDIKEFIVFETVGHFDEKGCCFPMSDENLAKAHRAFDELTPKMLEDLLEKNSRYLAGTVKEDGRFVYGYFSCFNKEIESYNSIRHALGVYGLAETYLVTEDQSLLEPLRNSLEYMIRELLYHVDRYSFVVDRENNNEIRLGGMSVAILAIAKSMEIFEPEERYLDLMRRLGEGILYMQNPATGKFTHVLRCPDLEVVEEFRIVYYSGEAAFALMRLYGLDKDEKWLKAVEKAFDYFIEEKYWKHADHWLAYCTNELTAVVPDDKYFEFGLKNTFSKMDFIMERITTWPTFLEMLTASYTMVNNIRRAGKEHLLQQYDVKQLETAMMIRARRQLDGIFFPETAMYCKSPQTILYGVFIRHHSLRVRNDDVAHHLSGYCHYLKDVLLKEKEAI